MWDKENNYLRLHRRLTPDHFQLNSTLVWITSDLIKAYYSSEPITNTQDEWLTILASVAAYFHEWHDYCKKEEGLMLKENLI